jgi:hypothetical protein
MRVVVVWYFLLLATVVSFAPLACARADSDEAVGILSTNTDLIITITSSILAVVLFVISFFAYIADRRTRFLFVMAAFFLFAVKGVLIALNDLNNLGLLIGLLDYLIKPFSGILTPLSRLLDFGVLIFFFLGMLRK